MFNYILNQLTFNRKSLNLNKYQILDNIHHPLICFKGVVLTLIPQNNLRKVSTF